MRLFNSHGYCWCWLVAVSIWTPSLYLFTLAEMGKNCLVNYSTNFTEAVYNINKGWNKVPELFFSNILTKLQIRHFVWFSEPSNPSLQFVNASDVIHKKRIWMHWWHDCQISSFKNLRIQIRTWCAIWIMLLKKLLKTLGRPCPVNFHLLKNPQWIWTAAPVQFFFLAYKNCSIHNFRNSL